ncbi:hypothetical protein CCR95_19965 [Thiocystis minor]|nr:hypothetical protein [Thiocystis minor]MBK5966299.1 hypothetical protein [Thiocystis minor]
MRVSSVGLIRVDRNRDRVPTIWAGKVVSVRLTAATLRVVADAPIIAEHARHVGRDQLIGHPWHSLPILERQAGAWRHGIPFQERDLPAAIRVVRDRLLKALKGDRAFVERLLLARELGREVACELTIETGVIRAPVAINARRRLATPVRPTSLDHPPTPTRRREPLADCRRDDRRREVRHGH